MRRTDPCPSNSPIMGARASSSATYLALVWGAPPRRTGTIYAPIGRHPSSRVKMAIVPEARGGREAVTHYRVLETFGGGHTPVASLLECRLETGRTHQVRVHLSSIGTPLIGDPLYAQGFKSKIGILPEEVQDLFAGFTRQALHASSLSFLHPVSDTLLEFNSHSPGRFCFTASGPQGTVKPNWAFTLRGKRLYRRAPGVIGVLALRPACGRGRRAFMASQSLPSVSAHGGLTRYLEEIRQFPMLEPQQEFMLAKSWREHGDRDAAHQLVTSHLRLVAQHRHGLSRLWPADRRDHFRRQCRPDAGGEALRAGQGLPPRHLCHVVDQGRDPGIHPALLEPREDGHHGRAEEALLQSAQDQRAS